MLQFKTWMRHQGVLFSLLAIWLASAATVQAETIYKVAFTLNSGQTESLTLSYYTYASDTQTSTVSGTFLANVTWDNVANTITGISFIPVTAPGSISFSDVNFSLKSTTPPISQSASLASMKGDLETLSGHGTLSVTSGSFAALGNQVDLNGGTVTAAGGITTEKDLLTTPATATLNSGVATITGTPSTGFSLTLPVNFTLANAFEFPGVTAIGTGTWTATGVAVPEPGTFALLLGLGLSLFGYRLWKRRS